MSTSYKRLSFTNEQEENLIEFIKQHPALWDANHIEYANGELRKIYWASIAAELSKSVIECRRKWRFIRDYYIHKRRRFSDSTPQRDGKYFNLHFLDKIAVRRVTNPQNSNSAPYTVESRTDKCNVRTIERLSKIEADLEDSEVEYSIAPDVTFEKVTMERIDQGHSYFCDDEDGSTTNPDLDGNDETVCDDDFNGDESSMVHEYVGAELKLNGHEEERINEEHYVESGVVSKQKDNPSSSMRDRAIDLFFESMAAAVKTLPGKYVAEAKFKVFSAINELEMKVQSEMNEK